MVPNVEPSKPLDTQSPWKFFAPEIPMGVNVWWWTNNTISEQQPPFWDAFTNADGSISPGVRKVYYGGHDNPVTSDEVVMLTAAGYGAYIS
jgi:hypothetical protein